MVPILFSPAVFSVLLFSHASVIFTFLLSSVNFVLSASVFNSCSSWLSSSRFNSSCFSYLLICLFNLILLLSNCHLSFSQQYLSYSIVFIVSTEKYVIGHTLLCVKEHSHVLSCPISPVGSFTHKLPGIKPSSSKCSFSIIN